MEAKLHVSVLLLLQFITFCSCKDTITIAQPFKEGGDLLISKQKKFALGFFSVKQFNDKGFGIETKPDKFLDDIIQLVSSTSAWRAAFENQNLSDINTIGVKIQMAQDGILMSFPQEFKHEEYMKLYMQYYYYMGVMFGKRV